MADTPQLPNNDLLLSEDGSSTLYNHRFGDSYHSIHGAIDESMLVYLKNGFENSLQTFHTHIHVFELGFGTGLNALLTILEALKNNIHLRYESIEAYPITNSEVEKLNYPERILHPLAKEIFEKLHNSPWNIEQELFPKIKILKREIKLEEMPALNPEFHVIYYDAFGASKQPEMWTVEMIEKIAKGIVKNGIFVTYSTNGQLKRTLKNLNFKIEKLPGPKGKREVLKATKQ